MRVYKVAGLVEPKHEAWMRRVLECLGINAEVSATSGTVCVSQAIGEQPVRVAIQAAGFTVAEVVTAGT
jgi:hypothetical protein